MTPSAAKVPSGRHAVLSLDPGDTSGVAACYVDLQPTLKKTLLGLDNRKAVEIKGGWLEQAKEIAALMVRFEYNALVEHQIPIDNIHIVIEDFVLRMPAVTTNLGSIWIAAGAVALYGKGQAEGETAADIVWQQPSHAKTLATNDRLKLWNLWEVGSEHKRDAWRHIALRVNGLVA